MIASDQRQGARIRWAALLAVVMVAAACASSDPGDGASAAPTTVSAPAPATSTAGSSNASTTPAALPVTFTVGGDIGAGDETDATLAAIARTKPRFHLALGDLGYSDLPSEQAWCDYVTSFLGTIPFQLVVGNHEDDDRMDGHIDEFAACLPDRMESQGTYARDYFFDVGQQLRVIMIAADNDLDGDKVDYEVDTEQYRWLRDRISEARSGGTEWVVVGMHKVCISAGNKDCEVGTDLLDLLIEMRVDLVFHGHDHDYQRSKQLSCARIETYEPSCVVDADDELVKGAGTVWIVNGLMGGGGITDIDRDDPEFGYLAAAMGDDDPGAGRGFVQVDVGDNELRVQFVGSTATYTDSFRIVG